MAINGATRLAGLIGRDIAYTLSPQIHNFALRKAGRNNIYVPFDMAEEAQLKSLLNSLWDIGVVGLNVTQPYKKAVSAILGATDIPAVNTLSRDEHGWRAHATDGVGLERALRHVGVDFRKTPHWVFLGDGGAVEAILWHAMRVQEEWKSVRILRRHATRDASWRKITQGRVDVEVVDFDEAALKAALARTPEALLVQASSAPLHGDDLAWLAPALHGFQGAFVDLLYGNRVSALLTVVRQAGLRCQDGLPMLIEQARAAQEIWWGEAASYADLLSHLQAVACHGDATGGDARGG